jgi:signal transduction histidine kinase
MISDTIKGLNIIENHGNGLIKFVESYRSLTQLPKPEFGRVSIMEFFERITILVNSNYDSEADDETGKPALTTEVTPSDLTLMADDKLLAMVFINLIKNSTEAFDNACPGNKISLHGLKNQDGKVVLLVKDNGPGMDSETLEKIFVPFFTTKETGSGIGLSLSRQIVRIHNGSITCDSVPGEGTTVTMLF